MFWREELAMRVPEIDRQHRELVALAAEVYQKIVLAGPQPALLESLDQLIETTRSHFISEEGHMLARGYPRFDEHREEHRRLLEQFGILRNDVAAGHAGASELLASLVRTLTEQHMLFSDQALGRFMNRAEEA